MERSFLRTEIDDCCLGNSVDDKSNTIYGYFVAERSGSNDLRYHPAESRTLTPVNQTQPNHRPATDSKNWANFLTELTLVVLHRLAPYQCLCITNCLCIWQVRNFSVKFSERVKQFFPREFLFRLLCPYFGIRFMLLQ